jgi:hypothetical protein
MDFSKQSMLLALALAATPVMQTAATAALEPKSSSAKTGAINLDPLRNAVEGRLLIGGQLSKGKNFQTAQWCFCNFHYVACPYHWWRNC